MISFFLFYFSFSLSLHPYFLSSFHFKATTYVAVRFDSLAGSVYGVLDWDIGILTKDAFG